ncbi:MAG: ATP-binding protein [bacterium]
MEAGADVLLVATLIEALDALPDAVAVFDYELSLRYVNRIAATHLRAAGIDPKAIIGKPALDVLPDMRGSEWEEVLREVVRTREPASFERHSQPLGRWTETRIVPSASMITTYTRDMATRREAEQRAANSEALLHAILNNTIDAIYVKDREGRYLAINNAGAASVGSTPQQVIGHTNFDYASEELSAGIRAKELAVMKSGVTTRDEEHVRENGEDRVYLIARGAWYNADDVVGGTVGVATDITERRRRERDSTLLAEAGRALAESLDFRTTLHTVAQLVTPTLADWCSVAVLNAQGVLESLAVTHIDPAKMRLAKEMAERYPSSADAPSGPPNVVRSGKSELHPTITDDMLIVAARDQEHLDLLRQIGMRSVMIVPMMAHRRILGAITLICADSGRVFSESDLPVAEELARRSALAIENAELFQAAAAANRAKSEFLASMSHELRTPLNAIIGYVELLSEGISGPVTPAQQEQLLRVRASAGHLLGLIDEVLSFSRMEAGHERVSLQHVAVSGVLEEAASLVRPMAAAKKLPLIIMPPPPELRVHTDLLKLRQMIVNLLTNAVKFTDSGSVTLSATADADTIRFSVQDTGIGISANHLRSVFEPFWQVEQHASRRVGGTGLGLSVTRRLARLLGGDVHVESSPGQGSTFVITLPRALHPGH